MDRMRIQNVKLIFVMEFWNMHQHTYAYIVEWNGFMNGDYLNKSLWTIFNFDSSPNLIHILIYNVDVPESMYSNYMHLSPFPITWMLLMTHFNQGSDKIIRKYKVHDNELSISIGWNEGGIGFINQSKIIPISKESITHHIVKSFTIA